MRRPSVDLSPLVRRVLSGALAAAIVLLVGWALGGPGFVSWVLAIVVLLGMSVSDPTGQAWDDPDDPDET